MTLLNPCASEDDLAELPEVIVARGRSLELELGGHDRMLSVMAPYVGA